MSFSSNHEFSAHLGEIARVGEAAEFLADDFDAWAIHRYGLKMCSYSQTIKIRFI